MPRLARAGFGRPRVMERVDRAQPANGRAPRSSFSTKAAVTSARHGRAPLSAEQAAAVRYCFRRNAKGESGAVSTKQARKLRMALARGFCGTSDSSEELGNRERFADRAPIVARLQPAVRGLDVEQRHLDLSCAATRSQHGWM